MGFPTMSDKNQAVQPQKLARSMNLDIGGSVIVLSM